MSTKLTLARVLVDHPSLGLKADQLLEADPALVKSLASGGVVDPHKDAVAYARANNAQVVRVEDDPAAEAAATQKAAGDVQASAPASGTSTVAGEPAQGTGQS